MATATGAEKPLIGVAVIAMMLPCAPYAMVCEVGSTDTEKSGGGAATRVRETVLVWVNLP